MSWVKSEEVWDMVVVKRKYGGVARLRNNDTFYRSISTFLLRSGNEGEYHWKQPRLCLRVTSCPR